MLKTAIVYLQGSGGNLLSRALALSEQTVAYLPKQVAEQQPTLTISARDRLNLYNNWNSSNWTQTEKDIAIWYHHGNQHFYRYEDTSLWLIDQFHPAMFADKLEKKVLFESTDQWQHLIFIQWQPSSLDTIKKLAKIKRVDLGHVDQINFIELAVFEQLTKTYPAHVVNWEEMLHEETFINAIQELSEKLNLVLDFSLVRILWKKWKAETDKILLLHT